MDPHTYRSLLAIHDALEAMERRLRTLETYGTVLLLYIGLVCLIYSLSAIL
jgi:hypothetical protein